MFAIADKPFLGLDIGSRHIKLALLGKSGKGYELLNFGVTATPDEAIVDGEIENAAAIGDAVKKLIESEKIPTQIEFCVFSMAGKSTYVRKITVPLMNEDDLAESIQQEAEQYIPFDIDEVNVDFEIVNPEEPVPGPGQKYHGDAQMEVLLVAARKDQVADRRQIIEASGLEAAIVDLDVFAMENSFEAAYGLEEDDTVALINIGGSLTNVNVIENGITSFTRDIEIGGTTIAETIQSSADVDLHEAERMMLGHVGDDSQKQEIASQVKAGVQEIGEEIKKTFDMFSRSSESRVRMIYLSGGCVAIEGVAEIIANEVGLNCEIVDPFRNLKISKKTFDPEYLEAWGPMAVIAVGLAARALDDKKVYHK